MLSYNAQYVLVSISNTITTLCPSNPKVRASLSHICNHTFHFWFTKGCRKHFLPSGPFLPPKEMFPRPKKKMQFLLHHSSRRKGYYLWGLNVLTTLSVCSSMYATCSTASMCSTVCFKYLLNRRYIYLPSFLQPSSYKMSSKLVAWFSI